MLYNFKFKRNLISNNHIEINNIPKSSSININIELFQNNDDLVDLSGYDIKCYYCDYIKYVDKHVEDYYEIDNIQILDNKINLKFDNSHDISRDIYTYVLFVKLNNDQESSYTNVILISLLDSPGFNPGSNPPISRDKILDFADVTLLNIDQSPFITKEEFNTFAFFINTDIDTLYMNFDTAQSNIDTLSDRQDTMNVRLDTHESQITMLDAQVEELKNRLDGIVDGDALFY